MTDQPVEVASASIRRSRGLRRGMAAGVGVLGLGAIAVGTVSWQGASFLMHPAPFVIKDEPSHYGLTPQDVSIPTTTVTEPLKGWFFQKADDHHVAVLFLHGWRSHRRHMLHNYLSWLAKRYTVLAVDFANNGESPAGVTTCGPNEVRDAQAAVGWLKGHGYERLGVLGTSMGGEIAIDLAAAEPSVKAVVTDAAFATPTSPLANHFRQQGFPVPGLLAALTAWMLGMRTGTDVAAAGALNHVAAIAPRPVMFIHGDQDHVVPVADATALYEAAGSPKSIWLVPGADHMSEEARSPHGLQPAEYERRVAFMFDPLNH